MINLETLQNKLNKINEEISLIDEEYEELRQKLLELRQKLLTKEKESDSLRNKRANINKEITTIKNKDRKKFGISIIRREKGADNVVEFDTLQECYNFIDVKMKDYRKKKIKTNFIRIDFNPEKE